jgi:hypothetical protein
MTECPKKGVEAEQKANQLDLTGASQQVPTVDIQTRKKCY